MANRHKGFYDDIRTGRHDVVYDDQEPVSPDAPDVEGRRPSVGFTLMTPVDQLEEAVGAGYTRKALEDALKAAKGSVERAAESLRIDPTETRMDEGEEFTFEEFLDYYGEEEGRERWGRAKRKVKKPKAKKTKLDAKSVKITSEQLAEMTSKSAESSPRKIPSRATLPKPSSTIRLEDFCSSQDEGVMPSPTPSGRSSPAIHRAKKPLKTTDQRVKGKKDGDGVTSSEGLPDPCQIETKEEDGKCRMNVVVVGHVDAGKSTIMGHILYKLDLVPQRVIHKFERDSKAKGKASFHFAWVLDETEEERERGVTMDVAVSYFETEGKKVTLLDCPGHRDFVANMITGAAQADCAIIVVNAVNGEFESGFSAGGQTKEHIMLLRSVGVSQLIIAVNKLDTVGYNATRYESIKTELSEYLKKSGFKLDAVRFIPIAGLPGENLTSRSNPELTSWYDGPTLIEGIDKFNNPKRLVRYPARLCVSDVMKSATLGNVCVGGKLVTGSVAVGDKVVFHPSGDAGVVKGIERNMRGAKEATAGDNVEVGLSGMDPAVVLSIGDVMCLQEELPVKICQKFEATLLAFSDQLITKSFPALLHLQSATVACSITRLLTRNDPKTSELVKKPKCFVRGQTGTVEITTTKPISLELGHEFRDLGRFMLRANGETIAAGVVRKIYPLVRS